MFAHTAATCTVSVYAVQCIFIILLSLPVLFTESSIFRACAQWRKMSLSASRHAHVYHVNVLSVTLFFFCFSDLMTPLQYAILKKD